MRADEVLDAAADAIDKYGHAKHALGDKWFGMCAQGAMLFACYGRAQWPKGMRFTATGERLLAPELHRAMRALQESHRAQIRYTSDWNNAPERTQDEVTSTMRAVAATLRASTDGEVTSASQMEQVSV